MIKQYRALEKNELEDEENPGLEIFVNNNMLTLKFEIVETGETEDVSVFDAENIISGRCIEVEGKRHSKGVEAAKEYSETVKFMLAHPEHYKNKTKWIQALACEGLERAEIANLLGLRYQQVRQALIQINK